MTANAQPQDVGPFFGVATWLLDHPDAARVPPLSWREAMNRALADEPATPHGRRS
jgi:hypothetical protein